MARPSVAVLYEHPEWFKPLFAELEQRNIAFVPLYAGEFSYDPAARSWISLVGCEWMSILQKRCLKLPDWRGI